MKNRIGNIAIPGDAEVLPHERAHRRRALQQSPRVVFDCRRMKSLPDAVVERELRKYASELRSLKHLILVNHRGEVIDIR